MELVNKYRLLKLRKVLKEIKSIRNSLRGFSEGELQDFYKGLKEDKKALEKSLAVGIEVLFRVTGIELYDEQVLCAIGMCQGNACEMKTGEGKTLSIALSVINRALYGNVLVVTVNHYLAERDYKYLKDVYEMLGLTCGVNRSGFDKDYEKFFKLDIIYTSPECIVFDYLKEEMEYGEVKNIKLETAIIDEIDFILLDNANSEFTVT